MAQTTLRIFGKRIHIIFALPKGNVQHELALWRRFKPKLRKLQRHNTPAIYEVDNLASVHRIARYTIRVPTNDAVGFSALYASHHGVKNRPAGNFRRLFFHKLLQNFQAFSFGKGAQFCDLRLNTQNLLILNIGGLAGVQKEFLLHIFYVKT
ncbi:hypothetical protein KKG58_00040 [Patescibacteria group bacterium]|nr:hypothetical protein [Patescibacteria group bacterium]